MKILAFIPARAKSNRIKNKNMTLLNKKPSSKKVEELNNLFPHNGKWHTVFEEKDVVYIDGVRVFKKDKESWT